MSYTRASLLRDARERLTASESPALDAELLLCFVLSVPRSALFSGPEEIVKDAERRRFDELLDLRASGKPLAYLVGERDFWTLRLAVDESTLIPRPETEHLIEQALAALKGIAKPKIADLGTGTGAIALALASEIPDASITATDISEAALECAQRNADAARINNVAFFPGEWLAALPARRFDLIVSNPPYIESEDPALVEPPLVFEPRSALDGGPDGLRDLQILIAGARDYLCSGARLMLEHGNGQGAAVRTMFRDYGYEQIASVRDLAGHERVTQGSA